MADLIPNVLKRRVRAAAEPDTLVGQSPQRADGRARVVIEGVTPQIDSGRYAAKRVVGETFVVEADVFADGHDVLVCVLRCRHESDTDWTERRMTALGNDRWRGEFRPDRLGAYRYTVVAWVDHLLTWRHDLARRVDAADIAVARQIGTALISDAATRATPDDAVALREWERRLANAEDPAEIKTIAADEAMAALATRHADRRLATQYERELPLTVDRERARYSTWYELFPRSAGAEPGRHGTLKDCEARLPYVAELGFDVLYLPPVHPIGGTQRKGKNNTLGAAGSDVGSPWAIGAAEGGHKAIHPELGTLEDFRRLVARAQELGIEIALDIAFQVSPDHPYVREHPEWFTWRPDGTVQYAENPPKKYQDIYPFNFETPAWTALWEELKSVLEFWIGHGVRIFRVDNPHTKPFPFWEWVIAELKARHPDVILLSEAFTRPKVMHRLAKLGFTQSYTYFAWRNTKHEITQYFTELAHGPGREYFRPNAWPNTPDILTEYLQHGGRPAFAARVLLAATLAASYGIYGPAYELIERKPREPGGEEYLDSEKYQLRQWDLDSSESLRWLIQRLNEIRRDNPALQSDWSLAFLPIDNDQLIAYAKSTPDRSNIIVTVVNLDPHHAHSGWLQVDAQTLGLEAHTPYQMHDLLTDVRYLWQGPLNFVQLEPGMAHIFSVLRRVRTEHDFDYFG